MRGIQNASVRIPLGHYIFWNKTNNGYSIKLIEKTISKVSSTVGDISKLEVDEFHEGFRFYRF